MQQKERKSLVKVNEQTISSDVLIDQNRKIDPKEK